MKFIDFKIKPLNSTESVRGILKRAGGLLGIVCVGGAAACSSLEPVPNELNVSVSGERGPYIAEGLERGGLSEKVLRAMSLVPRHRFVPAELGVHAYKDRALPIGHQQTISQPFIVGLMTEAAGITDGSKVLEIGTGSGYQAAVLAELGARVFSIEIIPELAEEAENRLQSLGYDSVRVRAGDGWRGWPEEAPFDAIIVTAAAPSVPPQLLAQLANKGRLVIPLEQKESAGEKMLVLEKQDRTIRTTDLGPVRFVPLIGEGRQAGQRQGESKHRLGELERLLQTSGRLGQKDNSRSHDS